MHVQLRLRATMIGRAQMVDIYFIGGTELGPKYIGRASVSGYIHVVTANQ